jgi:hypothetical protein
VPSSLRSRLRWEERPRLLVVGMVSRRSSAKVNRAHHLPLTSPPSVTAHAGISAAEVSIHLKNQGEEAYKHDLYGDSIVITRRFTREGSSSYKIKSRDGKVVSNKREELSAICDHMNVQVDNPMNVLTQGTFATRSFLALLPDGLV